ncbi:hypothetical protein CLU79DRAFT_716999 [Phycomyces nitens]|nr:hypothetical protein CLU79DRAFT_716999 [Phycomyces nitens]
MCWRLWHHSVGLPADQQARSPPNIQRFISTLSPVSDGWHEALSPTPMTTPHSDCSRTTTPVLEEDAEEEEEEEEDSYDEDQDEESESDWDDDEFIIPIKQIDHCFIKTQPPRPVVRLSLLSAALCDQKESRTPFTLKHSKLASAVLTPIHPHTTSFLRHPAESIRHLISEQIHDNHSPFTSRPGMGWLENFHI